MAFNAFAAKNARVTIGGTAVTAKQWNVTVDADELETTNFESGGYHENITGIRKASFSIELNEDGSATLFGVVPVGNQGSELRLYLNATAAGVGPYWKFANWFCKSHGQRADVKDSMNNTIQGNGTATFVYPTGAAGSTS